MRRLARTLIEDGIRGCDICDRRLKVLSFKCLILLSWRLLFSMLVREKWRIRTTSQCPPFSTLEPPPIGHRAVDTNALPLTPPRPLMMNPVQSYSIGIACLKNHQVDQWTIDLRSIIILTFRYSQAPDHRDTESNMIFSIWELCCLKLDSGNLPSVSSRGIGILSQR